MSSGLTPSGVGDQLKLQLPSWVNMMQLIGFSKDFFELVRDIGEAKSKEEEERIIKNEAQKLKIAMAQPDQSKKMKEYLIRAMYCVMLGHDIPFAYVHALTMTQDPKIYNKRTGFLAVSLCLHENHELLLMVVNSIRKGLLSSNYLEICSALIPLCKLINADTIPAFLPTVVDLLSHPKAAVRKKAVMAVHRFWLKSPESISHLSDKLRVVLCDRDPSVMAASLCLFLDMARVDPTPFRDLIPSFVSILKQVSENRLPRSYEYHQVPAPWIQINLLKLLALLGADDQAASEHMYEVLLQAMQRAEKYKNNAGYAVLYEAIMSTTRIRANNALLEAAANSIGQLIRVRNHNLKYLGIQALAAIVRVAPRFVTPHQMEVIECLESTDESIKRKTLDLLYRMTNTKNVVVIVAKLIEYLQNTVATDELVRAELVSRINELAERYAPNNHWYIDTMNVMLQVGGSHVRPEVAYNLIRLISQESDNSEQENIQLRHYAVSAFLKSLESGESLPDIQVQVISWVVSEYGYLVLGDSSVSLDGIVARFADLMERPHADITTRGWILTGLLKLVAQLDHIPASILSLIQKYTRSRYPDLMMRAYEFLALVHNPALLGEVFTVDASCEDLEVDPKLSFLNAYANRGISSGFYKPYIPKELRKAKSANNLRSPVVAPAIPIAQSTKKELNFSYPKPSTPSLVHSGSFTTPVSVSTGSTPLTSLQPTLDATSTNQQLKVQNSVWTREGFVGKGSTTTTPATATTATTATPVSTPSSFPLTIKSTTGQSQPKLNEKQASLASQLFSGLSVSSGTASTPSPSKVAPKPRTPVSKSTSTLFATPTPTPHPPPASTSAPVSPLQSPPSIPAPSSADNFLIDLGDLSSAFSASSLKTSTPLKSSTPTPTSTSPQVPHAYTPSSPAATRLQNSPSPTISSSLMDDTPSQPTIAGVPDTLLSPSAPLASQITPGSNFEVSNLTYTPFMGSITDGSPTTSYERIGKEDDLLQVGFVKVLRAEETLVVLMLSNKSTYTLSDVTTTVQIPDHFSAELSADPLVRINAKTFSLAALPSARTVLEVISIKHKKHGYGLAITSQVQYTCEGRRANVSDCNIPVEINDLLRPHVITIEVVGKVWALHTHESKAKFTPATPVGSSSALLTRLKTDLSVHTVQVIGSEGIGAASLLHGELLLMHVVVGPQSTDITVRSKDKSFTDVVMRYLHRLLR